MEQEKQTLIHTVVRGIDETGDNVGLPIREGGLAISGTEKPIQIADGSLGPRLLAAGTCSSSLATVFTAAAGYKNVSIALNNSTDSKQYVQILVDHGSITAYPSYSCTIYPRTTEILSGLGLSSADYIQLSGTGTVYYTIDGEAL